MIIIFLPTDKAKYKFLLGNAPQLHSDFDGGKEVNGVQIRRVDEIKIEDIGNDDIVYYHVRTKEDDIRQFSSHRYLHP